MTLAIGITVENSRKMHAMWWHVQCCSLEFTEVRWREPASPREGAMNAIRLLDEQHDEVSWLFQQLDVAHTDAMRLQLLRQIADAIAIHTALEERVFYPAIYGERTRDLVAEGLDEHREIEHRVDDLLTLSPRDPLFAVQVKRCRQELEHHVVGEREALFPTARKLLAQERLEALGRELQAMTDEMKSTQPRRAVPHEAVQR